MILNNQQHAVELSEGISETKFTIQASGAAFSVLSDRLYSNKAKAIIRELSCNALDAQVSNGNRDRPFDIHLPTNLEPYFSVRDYGIGLTEFEACGGYRDVVVPAGSVNPDGTIVLHDYTRKEYVGGIFNTFFKSSKLDSNEQIGALGLGSKSPMCYTDSYTVISRKNGLKTFYSVHLNDMGEPAISKLDECESDEESGVEITVPIKAVDFHQFINSAAEVFEWFAVTPNFNITDLAVKKREYILTAKTWSLPKSRYSGWNRNNPVAIMGSIEYPIDTDHPKLRNTTLSRHFSYGAVFHFPNGSLDFAASRESLAYTDRTVKALLAATDQAKKDLPKLVDEGLQQCKNIWEAHQFYQNVIEPVSSNCDISLKLKYNGARIESSRIYWEATDHPGVTMSYVSIKGKIKAHPLSSTHSLSASKSDRIVEVDNAKELVRARHLATSTGSQVVLLAYDSPAARDAFMKTVDGMPSTLITDLPAAPKKAKSTAVRFKMPAVTASITDISNNKPFYPNGNELDSSIGGVYTLIERNRPIDANGVRRTTLDELCTAYCHATDNNANITVYGVTKKNAHALEADPNWVSLDVFLEKEINKFVDSITSDVLDYLHKVEIVSGISYQLSFMLSIPEMKNFPKDHIVSKLQDAQNEYNNRAANVKVTAIANSLRYVMNNARSIITNLPVIKESTLVKELTDKYPLTQTMYYYPNDPSKGKAFSDYFKAIDQFTGKA